MWQSLPDGLGTIPLDYAQSEDAGIPDGEESRMTPTEKKGGASSAAESPKLQQCECGNDQRNDGGSRGRKEGEKDSDDSRSSEDNRERILQGERMKGIGLAVFASSLLLGVTFGQLSTWLMYLTIVLLTVGLVCAFVGLEMNENVS
jgi:hypothetical protein